MKFGGISCVSVWDVLISYLNWYRALWPLGLASAQRIAFLEPAFLRQDIARRRNQRSVLVNERLGPRRERRKERADRSERKGRGKGHDRQEACALSLR